MSLAAEVTRFERSGIAELPLEIQLVLLDVRRLAVIVVDQHQGLRDADQRRRRVAGIISQRQNRILPSQVMVGFGDLKAADKIAAHVEHRIADILDEKDAGAKAHGPFRGGAPGDAQARREVAVVRLNEPVAQTPVPRDRNGRVEPDWHVLIKIAAAHAGT